MIETLKSKSINADNQIIFWRANPVQAAKDILDVDLDWYQRIALTQMWFNTNQTNILSRGTGKSFLDAVSASLEGILKPSYRVGLISSSYRQSKFMWSELANLHQRSPLFQESTLQGPSVTPEKCYVKFKAAPGQTSSVIEALPLGTDGATIRGARYFSTYVDEAAQVPKDILDVVVRGFGATSPNPIKRAQMMREQQKMVADGLITKEQMMKPPANKLIFSTTAFYQYNHAWERVSKQIDKLQVEYRNAVRLGQDTSRFIFQGASLNENQIPHRVMTNGRDGLLAFTYWDPSPGVMDMNTIRTAKEEMPLYKYKMEYECLFPSDSMGFFRRSMLDKARSHNEFGPILKPRKGCIYVMGIDPARTSDNFSIAIFEIDLDAGMIRLVRVMSWNDKNFPLVHREVRWVIRHYNITYFQMDGQGGGTTFRDLLSEPENCPAGDRLILEQDNPDHMFLTGDRILGPLIQFSNGQWVHDANNNLLSALQHGRLQIAAVAPMAGQIWTQDIEDANDEIERTVSEMSNIVTTMAGSRMHWDTPTKNMRKDRYSAALIGFNAAEKILGMHNKPQSLAVGFFG